MVLRYDRELRVGTVAVPRESVGATNFQLSGVSIKNGKRVTLTRHPVLLVYEILPPTRTAHRVRVVACDDDDKPVCLEVLSKDIVRAERR